MDEEDFPSDFLFVGAFFYSNNQVRKYFRPKASGKFKILIPRLLLKEADQNVIHPLLDKDKLTKCTRPEVIPDMDEGSLQKETGQD